MSNREDIYRRIPVTIWDRKDFRDLSVNAKAIVLYLYMMTGGHTISVPGLFRAGKAALAEGLRWPLEMFEEGFSELEAHGMALADWEAPLVWLPHELNDFNRPNNQSEATGWINTFRMLPDCALRTKARAAVEAFLYPWDVTPSHRYKKKDTPSTPPRHPLDTGSSPVSSEQGAVSSEQGAVICEESTTAANPALPTASRHDDVVIETVAPTDDVVIERDPANPLIAAPAFREKLYAEFTTAIRKAAEAEARRNGS